MSAQVAKDLRAAAALLREKGWTQGQLARDGLGVGVDLFSTRACSFCMSGALERVSGGWYNTRESARVLGAVLPTPISEWNDAPGRTADEVIAALEQAATLAEAQS